MATITGENLNGGKAAVGAAAFTLRELEGRRWMARGQAARYLGISVDTLDRWARSGVVELHRLPNGAPRVDRASLDALLTPAKGN